MTTITLLNVIANIVITASLTHLTLCVFGRPDSAIYTNKFAATICKIAACVTLCGSVSNILTLSTPTWTEMVLNFGVSLNFLWLSYYDSVARPKHSSGSTVRKVSHGRKAKPRSSRQRREGSVSRED